MLRVGFRFIVPLAFIAVSALSPARGQSLAFGWGGYTFPQYGYGFGCPPVYYQPYCSSYAYGYPWAGYALPFYWGGYYPYRFGAYGYGNRFNYGPGLRYPVYRGFGGYRPGYPAYRGATPGLGYRGQFYRGGSGFGGGGFRGGGFRGGGRR